jgi:uncharacterized membrane protein
MNKFLVAVFDSEAAADVGLKALRDLHAAGDISLYATGVLTKEAQGSISVRQSMDAVPAGTATDLAVGSLIGLLGGPVGVVVGALNGTVAEAMRDSWVAGVSLDFIEMVEAKLRPGKVALIAEIEEEWVSPVDCALEAAGGLIIRRARTDIAEVQFDHDIATCRSEIRELESEASHAASAARAKLQAKLAEANAHLDDTMLATRRRVETLKSEAEAKAESLNLQLGLAKGDFKARIEQRMKRVKSVYHVRGARLSRAGSPTREALAA